MNLRRKEDPGEMGTAASLHSSPNQASAHASPLGAAMSGLVTDWPIPTGSSPEGVAEHWGTV